jgi:hypothetical protein
MLSMMFQSPLFSLAYLSSIYQLLTLFLYLYQLLQVVFMLSTYQSYPSNSLFPPPSLSFSLNMSLYSLIYLIILSISILIKLLLLNIFHSKSLSFLYSPLSIYLINFKYSHIIIQINFFLLHFFLNLQLIFQ